MERGRCFYAGLLICFCLTLLACSRVTRTNFEKIQPGMTMQAVVAVLGEPTESEGVNFAGISGTSAVWRGKNGEISIQFLNNRVQIKSFSQPGAGSKNHKNCLLQLCDNEKR
jgi:hypothetical protein